MFDRHYAVWPDYLPYQLALPQTSLYANLAISAQRYPDRDAILYYDTPMTYAELEREALALAGYLNSRGVARGDRVLLYMQNAPQYVVAFYAILRANAVVVPVNPMNRTGEIEHYARDTDARLCICGQERLAEATPLLDSGLLHEIVATAYSEYATRESDLELPAEVMAPFDVPQAAGVIAWRDALNTDHAPPAPEAGPDDLAVLPYSSGTTGQPKGCMHTHASVMATAVHSVVWSYGTSEGVNLATLPFFHVTGMQNSMNATIYAGATLVIMTRWDRRTAARLIERYRVNRWTNIVTMAVDLLADPEIESFDLSSLEYIGGGGAAMPAAVAEKLRALTGLDYIEGYGLSETMAATHINPLGAPKAQCLGIPVFGVDARIIDLETQTEVPIGETGEIVSNGPQVCIGYWNRPEATGEAFIEIDGKRFLRTGDIGRCDENGYFFMVDRAKRMINASGYKVWPAEVEALMFGHPEIREACVIATPDIRRGESVKACVVLVDGATASEADILAWCRDNMAAYKVPRAVEICLELPRSQTGKVMWRRLQEDEWEQA
ncbi:long-chain-fatty-acid--CoA ligase [Salinisphaera hydrothermalis]|uniref:Long-chain-fatty-acid--CoA ligase n=1 Tax=Salinisphaera hydrothermalis (strain C41B8) TaxID=1304275 RepID=A0A084ILR8_SALHC|nr:long-chain-fatty-acid--CoA ligase [Salinisphaera hydrothermalis]KEZ77652.1 long-chain-fatty-acid--CoA ligase [Salinisphaera hydrothermalis C41B8]